MVVTHLEKLFKAGKYWRNKCFISYNVKPQTDCFRRDFSK